MQIRCCACTKTIALAAAGELPAACPHCARPPGPGPLGPYEARRLLAAGGMGEVYVAVHRELGTEVAVKVLPAMPLDAIPALRERFAREARLTAAVAHPGVVKVLGSDVAGDRPYLVLELVTGQTLRERLRAGPVPVAEAARLAAATADVLAAAHAHGVLHRDVKPDNVMATADGSVRVLDFGIARCLQDDEPLTRTGEIVGTPEYMAPEQLLDGPAATSERTDVHALGVLLYELLTGRSPFHGANVFQSLKLVEALVPPPPSSLRPGVPQALDVVVADALHKEPAARCGSATAFAAAVRTALPPAAAPPASTPAPWWRAIAWLAAAALLLAAGAAWRFVLSLDTTQKHAVTTFGGAVGQGLATGLRSAVATLQLEAWLHEGRWNQAWTAAMQPERDGTTTADDLACEAFTLAHVAWPLAVGAPAWLAATDAAAATRLCGDPREAPPDATPLQRACAAALAGSGGMDDASFRAIAPASAARLRLLHARLAGDAAAPAGDEALARLLAIGSAPAATRADAWLAFAQRLPLDASEHWLARLCAHHLRGDRAEAERAAELAWLHGAGELAVLLDAWLQVAPLPGEAQWRPLHGRALERLRTRVAGADAADAPARTLLLAWLDARHGVPFDAAWLHGVHAPLATRAGAWFVTAAATHAEHAFPLLRVAVALGITPQHDTAPWRDVAAADRTTLDAEVRRGR